MLVDPNNGFSVTLLVSPDFSAVAGALPNTKAGAPGVAVDELVADIPKEPNGDGVSDVFLLSSGLSVVVLAAGAPNPAKGEAVVEVVEIGADVVTGLLPNIPKGEGAPIVFAEVSFC